MFEMGCSEKYRMREAREWAAIEIDIHHQGVVSENLGIIIIIAIITSIIPIVVIPFRIKLLRRDAQDGLRFESCGLRPRV